MQFATRSTLANLVITTIALLFLIPTANATLNIKITKPGAPGKPLHPNHNATFIWYVPEGETEREAMVDL
jgi:hypothetical protein